MPARTVNGGYYVDGETGEVVPVAADTTIMSAEERDGYRRKMAEKTVRAELVEVQKEMCGDFYWTLFESKEEYCPGVSDDMLSKIMYLIAFMDYETNLLVVQDGVTSPKRPMRKIDVAKIIRLHRVKFSRFWKDMLATGIIAEEDDGCLRVCSRFCKGDLIRKNMAAMKIFTHAVKYMYENVDVRTHQYISYLFRLIPYINLKYNVFCQNPLETDRTKIMPMTAKDMCRILGLSEENVQRFVKKIFKLSFIDKNGDERSVVNILMNRKNYEDRTFIIINPQFYAGYMNRGDMLSAIDEFKQGECLPGLSAPSAK